MSQYVISVPRKYRGWFNNKTEVTVEMNEGCASVNGEPWLQLVPLTGERYAVVKPRAGSAIVVGEFDKYTVRKTLNDRLMRQVGAIRSAVYGVSFPAPLAYVLRDRSLVHPGPCFDGHQERVTLRALYTVKNEEARCCVCQEAFV
jgi:hypothetical protein